MQGSPIQSPADMVVQFSKVITSSLHGTTNSLQYSVAGIGEFGPDDGGTIDNSDNVGEGTDDAEVFGAMGIVGRPLPPEKIGGQDFHLEVVCVRNTDGLTPIATRDLRLRMPPGAPEPGTIAFVGYGGGFHSLSAVDGGAGGTIHVIYCPYDFDGSGVAQKAHSITLDPSSGNESIAIVHSEGAAITITNEEIVAKSPDGTSFIAIKDGKIDVVTGTCTFNCGVVIGNSALAVPLLAGVASPPCSNLSVSP